MKTPLFSYFFKLRAEHIHGPVGVKVTTQRDVKPVALFAPPQLKTFSPRMTRINANVKSARSGGFITAEIRIVLTGLFSGIRVN